MRIGINVPNGLLQQVKEIRPEVNVSQACREALEHRVQVATIAAARAQDDDVEVQVERLDSLVSRPPDEPDWPAYGIEDAAGWVKVVTPEAWEQFIYQADFLRRQGRDETEMVHLWSQGGDMKGFYGRLREHDEWFEYQFELQFESGVTSDTHARVKEEYARAWLGYVNEVRRLLEKRRSEELKRLRGEREEYRRSLPTPEAPPQLTS